MSVLIVLLGAGWCLAGTSDDLYSEVFQILVQEMAQETDTELEGADQVLYKWMELADALGNHLKKLFGTLPNNKESDAYVAGQKNYYCPKEVKAKDIGVNKDVIRKAIAKFPSWWRNNIKDFVFCWEPRAMPSRYGIREDMIALVLYNPRTGTSEILYFPVSATDEEMMSRTYHESAHPNDWGAHSRPLKRRIAMAYEVYQRVRSENRFKDRRYVERIENKEDRKLELSDKIKEYWAQIVRTYFTNKAILPAEDILLVEKYALSSTP